MRRLITNTRQMLNPIIAVFVILFCWVALQTLHASNLLNLSSITCSSSCTNHSQAVPVINQNLDLEEIDKEPIPPPRFMPSLTKISLGLYGVSFVIAITVLARNLDYLRFKTLRF